MREKSYPIYGAKGKGMTYAAMVWDDAQLYAAPVRECGGYPCRCCSSCPALKFCTHEADHFEGRGFAGRE